VTLKVATAPNVLAGTTFTYMVPGHQRWVLRSVFAVADRGAGGTPNRSYTLTITDGTNPVAIVGADDAGTDPGTCSVTWADCPSSAVGAGSVGTSVGSLGPITLDPGYTITGTFANPVAGDAWESAVVWFDYVDTGQQ